MRRPGSSSWPCPARQRAGRIPLARAPQTGKRARETWARRNFASWSQLWESTQAPGRMAVPAGTLGAAVPPAPAAVL